MRAVSLGAETAKEQSVAKVSRDAARLHEAPRTYPAKGSDGRGLVISGEHVEQD